MEKMKTLTIKGTKYEIVDEVARGNSVPPIDSDNDNGKVLTVVEGKASWKIPLAAEYNHINVRDYGAVGDGVTDDCEAIIAAFEAAKSMLPCEVYFPAGIYEISKGMTIKMSKGSGGLRVHGAGCDITTIRYSNSYNHDGWYALMIQPESSPANEDEFLHDISITGLTVYDSDPQAHAIHPSKGHSGKEETHGFGLAYVKRAAVTDCQVISVGDEAINLDTCHDAIVAHNHIIGCPGAGEGGANINVGDGSDGVVVIGNTIYGGSEDETLEDGTVIQLHGVGIALESLYDTVSNVVIANNTIRNMHGGGIGMSAKNAGAGVYNVTITGNVITDCNDGIYNSGAYPKKGIHISDNMISGCRTLHGGAGNGIDLYGAKNSDITIADNTITDVDAKGINVTSDDEAVIDGNTIKNVGNAAIYIVNKAIIRGCTIANTGIGAAAGNAAISGYTNAVIRVYGCRITGVRQANGILKPTEVVDTTIEMVDADGNVDTSRCAFSGNLIERVVNCTVGGYISITKEGAIVQDVTANSTSTSPDYCLSLDANNIVVNGCHITSKKTGIKVWDSYVTVTGCRVTGLQAIVESGNNANNNLFMGNVLTATYTSAPVGILGDKTVAKNIVNGKWVDNTFPSVSAADNGKMLQVVDGKPTWVSITNGNEVAY